MQCYDVLGTGSLCRQVTFAVKPRCRSCGVVTSGHVIVYLTECVLFNNLLVQAVSVRSIKVPESL